MTNRNEVENKMFGAGEITYLNACVGNNGYVDHFTYADGYLEASEIIINSILEGKNYKIDCLIYPICYSIRHYLELTLKGYIERIQILAKIRDFRAHEFSFDFKNSHDIKKIWNWFKYKSERLDPTFNLMNKKIDIIINYVSSIDPTGQVFRYPKDNNETSPKKHLTNSRVINIYNIKQYLEQIKNYLEELYYYIKGVIIDYSLGTFTSKLSRCQLYEISDMLPKHDKWGTSEFKEIKKHIMEKYKIGSNDFGRALTKIKNQRILSNKIGITYDLLGLTQEELIYFLTCWEEVNKDIYIKTKKTLMIQKNLEVDIMQTVCVPRYAFDNNKEAFERHWKEKKEKVSPEIISGVRTLYYFSIIYNIDHVEHYDYYYQKLKKDIEKDIKAMGEILP